MLKILTTVHCSVDHQWHLRKSTPFLGNLYHFGKSIPFWDIYTFFITKYDKKHTFPMTSLTEHTVCTKRSISLEVFLGNVCNLIWTSEKIMQSATLEFRAPHFFTWYLKKNPTWLFEFWNSTLRGVFRTFELRVLTVIDCPKIADAKGRWQ